MHISREHCWQSCVACESVNYTKHSKVDFILDSKVDFTVCDYMQELAGLFYFFSDKS